MCIPVNSKFVQNLKVKLFDLKPLMIFFPAYCCLKSHDE